MAQIQERLSARRFSPGRVDGIFGNETNAAVRAFQRANGLEVDGRVGAITWAHLFGITAAPAETTALPLATRCLALTGSFETNRPIPDCFGGLAGDLDGQGLSCGALQWNLGQGSLQPLLEEMERTYGGFLEGIFGPNHAALEAMLATSIPDQLAWARSIQSPQHVLSEPWLSQFTALVRSPEFQEVQVRCAAPLQAKAMALCVDYGLSSQRGLALLFDIVVQDGTIRDSVRTQILSDFRHVDPDSAPADKEVARLRSIGIRAAEAAKPQWVSDVMARKLTIANGHGTVHGRFYDLARQYAITLDAIPV